MKKIKLTLVSALLLIFCSFSVIAQDQSAENSNVIETHHWFETYASWWCDGLSLWFKCEIHEIIKTMPDGSTQLHFIAIGNGIDMYGRSWNWHDTWIESWSEDDYQLIRFIKMHGPKGAEIYLRGIFILNGNGEIVQDNWKGECDF